MSVLTELDEIRTFLSSAGQPFELTQRTVHGTAMTVYKNLPPNLSQFVVQAFDYGDRTFLVRAEERFSYAEIIGRAAGLAKALRAQYGVAPGTRIAIAMKNSPEWIITFLAILLAGSTAVLVNSRGSVGDIANALQDTDCAVLIGDAKRVQVIAGKFSGHILIACADGVFRQPGGAPIEIEPATPQISAARPEDPAIIMFTSGTTGRPKGAVLTHLGVSTFQFGMRHNGAAFLIRMAKRLGLDPAMLASSAPQMATLALFPFFHVSGASAMILGTLINGGKIVSMERWDPAVALPLIARERITMLQGPPSIFWDILHCPALSKTDLSSVTNFGIGGQATPPHLIDALSRAFPNAAIGGGYGATETNGSIASSIGDEYLACPGGSGRIMPGVDVRIVSEDGQDLPIGGVGEIWVRSPLVMAGYWNQPEATQAAFSDGWLKMGDIGYLDEHRFITIVDRKRDMIIRGGENIYCAELERVFQQYPGVFEVAVFGVLDERWGERVVMTVVPRAGARVEAQKMLAFGRHRLAHYKIPSEILFSTTPFGRNVLGKIDKATLRDAYDAGEMSAPQRD